MKTVWVNAVDESFYGEGYVGPAILFSADGEKPVVVKTPTISGKLGRYLFVKDEDLIEDN